MILGNVSHFLRSIWDRQVFLQSIQMLLRIVHTEFEWLQVRLDLNRVSFVHVSLNQSSCLSRFGHWILVDLAQRFGVFPQGVEFVKWSAWRAVEGKVSTDIENFNNLHVFSFAYH